MERSEALELFGPLRVADVCDGLDWVGLGRNNKYHVDPAIRPLWRTRAVGIARTARYLPSNRTIPTMTPEEYSQFSGRWYNEICRYPWVKEIEKGDFVCIDASGTDVGLLGSNNVLEAINNGAAGIVTDGGCRDTDEVIIQRCPLWSRHISRTMVQGRLEFASTQEPIVLGGVVVRPGDIIVADGDGVVVVPTEAARDVAKWAHKEYSSDKQSRRRLYEAAGMDLDDTVR